MALRQYPVGIQTFEEIRKRDLFYADKTEYIYRMTHSGGKYFFLGRPRRFGKSLLVSTFESYFSGKRELFKGLAIEKMEKDWTEYPVLHFDLSGGKHLGKEQLERYLLYILKENERLFGIECDFVDANIRLMNLITSIYRQTGKQVVVLVDEYDAPLLDVVHDDEELEALRYVMRNFYSPLKKSEPMLRFVFMTGITKFSQLSIFSELNNVTNVSMDEPYAGVCGITEEELLTQMSDDIDRLAQHLELGREETVGKLKEQYDGYHFCWPSPDVYNPYSLLNCFARQKIDSYWFGSGTPTYLIKMMSKFDVLPSQISRTRAKASSFDAATEKMTNLTPLLYQSGYITIKGCDEETCIYTLDIPNKEIFVELFESLLPGYLASAADEGKVVMADISALLRRGNMDSALQLLSDFLETVPYCDNTNYEGHYQQVFYIMFALLTDYRIGVEQRTSKGRIDITLETDDAIYVMELKFGKTAQEALDQINAMRYAGKFNLSDKRIVKVGLNFAVKDEVNTLQWVVE